MSVISASFVVLAFATLAHLTGLIPRFSEVMKYAHNAMEIFRDPEKSDIEKETVLQQLTIKLVTLFGILLAGIAIAVTIPIGILWLIDLAGYPILDTTLDMLQRWDFLLAATIICTILYYSLRRSIQ